MVTIRQIALKLGVSPATVSSVLNGKEKERRINATVAARIRKVAIEEGYHANQVAVSLRTGKSKIIGLIVDNIAGAFFSLLANTIEKELDKYGFTVLYCSSGNKVEKMEGLIKILYQHNLDGYLIIPTVGLEEKIKLLTGKHKPVVLMDSYFPGTKLPYVLVNNFDSSSKGVAQLIRKGYRKPVMVGNDVPLIQMKERIRGFTETLQSRNIPFTEKDILITPYAADKKLIVRQITSFLRKRSPDAVFFAANYLGVCGLESIKKLGWDIPADIAVLCFDDHDLFPLYATEIAAIQQPVERIAETAVKILMGELGIISRQEQQQVELEGKLITRASM